MNNYLASIAARTLNPDSPVRPRLGGRFEPASPSREGSIDGPELASRAAAKLSPLDFWRDRASALETTEQRGFGRPPGESDIAPQLGRSAMLTRERNHAPPPALTLCTPDEETLPATKLPLQNAPIEVRPVERVIAETIGSRGKTRPATREENWPEPRFEKLDSNPVAPHRQSAEEASPLATARSSNSNKFFSDRGDERELGAPTSYRASDIGVEPIVDQSARRNKSSLQSPRSIAESSSDARERAISKTPPVVVQSRIAPLVESGAGRLSLNRLGVQAQPTVHVTIGRIEIRAVQSAQSPARPQRSTAPSMNLDDYLRRRNQAGSR